MGRRRCRSSVPAAVAVVVAVGCFWGARAEEGAADEEPDSPVVALRDEDRPKALLVCKHAIWKKWSGGMEDISILVNATIASSRPNGEDSAPALNYAEAARLLAERQLATCIREVTAADIEVDKAGSLSDTAVDRMLGGPAPAEGLRLDAAEKDQFDQAFRSEVVNSDAPSIMGVQVHQVPRWLQMAYLVGVILAMCGVLYVVVQRLTARDREKHEKEKEKKKKG
mmetsp:Transcript_2035/g.5144  ORF Transcript_2035/g.5144 Transcript_2035/m.5144 type:complete len:225 (-) Transcript_2035:40-714(-)|eukprot:CAMPEP_0183397726 /NCGR_PEP_ID=MMETSP0370-20130417/10795_1 /TAXON_ID=268820 /ORGANISM="Peridinium aciculiferum, Strain PAER-2" /LENGTH=224 /DNA_ID=CAMNT_0025578659 /DNA_START=61 /DNA_END=735 /DNA_ORIENTATION=-